MSGREFVAVWAIALGFTAAAVGWAYAALAMVGQDWAGVALGAGAPLAVVMGAMWLGVRRA